MDGYTLQARAAPAAIAGLPAAALLTSGLFSAEQASRIMGFVTAAVALLITQLVRDAGSRLQPALFVSWGGSPTVRRVRWRDAPDRQAAERVHRQLAVVYGEALPTEDQEQADPASADRRYEEALSVLRERTRDTERFRLVFAENVNYGFRRNLLGLRPYGLGAAILGAVVSVVGLALAGNAAAWIVSAALCVALALLWWRVVTPSWVRPAAERYADQLLAAADSVASEAEEH